MLYANLCQPWKKLPHKSWIRYCLPQFVQNAGSCYSKNNSKNSCFSSSSSASCNMDQHSWESWDIAQPYPPSLGWISGVGSAKCYPILTGNQKMYFPHLPCCRLHLAASSLFTLQSCCLYHPELKTTRWRLFIDVAVRQILRRATSFPGLFPLKSGYVEQN